MTETVDTARPRTTVRIDPPPLRDVVTDAWADRRTGVLMAQRLITKTYVRTILGRAWLVLRPLMATVGMALIFGALLNAGSAGGVPYIVFLLVGMMAWQLFDRPLYWSTRSFDRFRKMTRTLRLPLLLVPFAGAGPGVLECAITFVLMVLVIVVASIADGTMYLQIGPETLGALAALAGALLFGQGIGLVTSVLNARARDVRFLLTYGLQIWLFATPVVYPISRLSEPWRTLAEVNPLTSLVEVVKWGLIDAGDFSAAGVAWSVVATVLSVLGGLWFFTRKAETYIELSHATGDEQSGDEDDDDDLI